MVLLNTLLGHCAVFPDTKDVLLYYRNWRMEMPDEAFEIIREQLQHGAGLREQREAVAARIATGFAQAERGELTDGRRGNRHAAAAPCRAAQDSRMSAPHRTAAAV